MKSAFSSKYLIFTLFCALALFASVTQAYTQICRCDCGTNYTIVELPDEGLSYTASCTNCTKKFCIAQNFTMCQDVDEVLFSASCFQRESLKEQFFIYTFIIITSGLLIYAAVAPYAQKRFGLGGQRNVNSS